MKDSKQLIDLQNKIVRCYISAAKQPWDFVVVNFEREEIDGEPAQDVLALAFLKENATWKRTSFVASYECDCLLLQLAESMAMPGEVLWGSCLLEVDATGKYRFSYSYEQPKRLNSNFDDEALLKTYTPTSW